MQLNFFFFNEDLYKENTNAIVGKEPNSELILDVDLKAKSIQEIVYSVAKSLKVMDDNIIKLIEVSSYF